jgi:hypothetical protein
MDRVRIPPRPAAVVSSNVRFEAVPFHVQFFARPLMRLSSAHGIVCFVDHKYVFFCLTYFLSFHIQSNRYKTIELFESNGSGVPWFKAVQESLKGFFGDTLRFRGLSLVFVCGSYISHRLSMDVNANRCSTFGCGSTNGDKWSILCQLGHAVRIHSSALSGFESTANPQQIPIIIVPWIEASHDGLDGLYVGICAQAWLVLCLFCFSIPYNSFLFIFPGYCKHRHDLLKWRSMHDRFTPYQRYLLNEAMLALDIHGDFATSKQLLVVLANL